MNAKPLKGLVVLMDIASKKYDLFKETNYKNKFYYSPF